MGLTFPSLPLCGRGEYKYRSQTAKSNLQEKYSNGISDNTINSPQNTPVQNGNHIQILTRSIHSRLALKTTPQRKQR